MKLMTSSRWTSSSLGLATLLLAGSASLMSAPAPAAGTLRELSTDRPDATESPFTVDAGHVQVEMDAASFTRNRLDGVRTTEWVVAPFNLRYGVSSNAEVGIFVTPYVRVTEQPRGGAKTTTNGAGDTTLRTKFNFWGNDGGANALGLIADVKIPTAANGLGNDKIEASAVVPFAFEVGAGWEGAAMSGVASAITDRGRRPVLVNTITFAREILPELGGFLELTSESGVGPHVATFNCGLTRRFGPHLQLDAGAYIGISRTAPDLTLFVGLARKY